MHSSGRNEGPMLVIVDKSSRSSSCNDGEECEEPMGAHLVANKKTIKSIAENDCHVEIFAKNERYLKRAQRLLGKWWENYILP